LYLDERFTVFSGGCRYQIAPPDVSVAELVDLVASAGRRTGFLFWPSDLHDRRPITPSAIFDEALGHRAIRHYCFGRPERDGSLWTWICAPPATAASTGRPPLEPKCEIIRALPYFAGRLSRWRKRETVARCLPRRDRLTDR